MAVIADLMGIGSAQYIDDVAHSEAFFCSCHAREEFLRIDGAVFQNDLAQAVIAVAAVVGRQYLAKVGQQGVATTDGTIAIGQNLLQLLMGKKLFVLTRFLSNNVLDLEAVTRVKKEDSLGWKANKTARARLLVITLEVA